ncbi:MAG: fibronectin type III domain-containing protein [Candidatus Nanopelagicales bacterium]|nr:fibronectin type III domain-containing protein [Candidatus Nanopelagicales bacterium]
MRRLLTIVMSTLALVTSLIAGAIPASAADAGTFTLSGFTSANLTVDNLTITRDANGAYTAAIDYTVGGRRLRVNPFPDQGCAANGIDCHIINGGQIRFNDNFTRAYFTASLSGMDTSSPTVTITEAWTGADHWTNEGSGASAPLAAVLEQHLTCTATLNGSTSADLTWSDPGSGATSYDITASPALSSPVSVSSGPTATTVKGLDFGTSYTFTVTGVGGKAKAATCSVRT